MTSDEALSVLDQYEALRSARGVATLTGWSSVTLAGADRQAFLHNFCTNDVKRLSPGECCEAFFCDVKGRTIGHGLVTCRDRDLVVIGPPGQGARLAAHLERYVIRDDVVVRDTTTERSYLVASDDAGKVLGSSVSFRWRLLGGPSDRVIEWMLADTSTAIEELAQRGFVPCSHEAFQALRVEAGIPLYGVDFDDDNFPQEIGRDVEAISFTKGCYLGQETVARIDALGHVNRRIIGVAFSGSAVPAVGTALTQAGAPAGRVTSSTFSPAFQRPLTLAMVRREQTSIGTRLDSALGPAEVVAIPITR